MRQSPTGLVLAIPKTFAPSLPPFTFTSSHSSLPLSSLYTPVPSCSAPTVHSVPDFWTRRRVFSPHPQSSLLFPSRLSPSASIPILYIHIGTYAGDGKTVVGISCTHAVFDAVGVGLVLREWEAAVRDPQGYAELPPLVDVREGDLYDPLEQLRTRRPASADRTQERTPEGWSAFGGWDVLVFFAVVVWRWFWDRWPSKVLYLPSECLAFLSRRHGRRAESCARRSVADVVAKFNDELKAIHGEETYVGTGDVIGAVLWKASHPL